MGKYPGDIWIPGIELQTIKNLVNMQSKNCNFHRENEFLNMLNSPIFDDIQFSENPIYLQSSIFEK